jgi:hypothetical protein
MPRLDLSLPDSAIRCARATAISEKVPSELRDFPSVGRRAQSKGARTLVSVFGRPALTLGHRLLNLGYPG